MQGLSKTSLMYKGDLSSKNLMTFAARHCLNLWLTGSQFICLNSVIPTWALLSSWRQKRTHLFWRVWKIVRRCSPYNASSKRCYLCLNEKLDISKYRGNNLLNKKTELISKCRHQNKYTLSKYDTKDWRQLYCKKPLYCNFFLYIL